MQYSAMLLPLLCACAAPDSFEGRLLANHVALTQDGEVVLMRGDGREKETIAAPDMDQRWVWSDATLACDGRTIAVVRRDGPIDTPNDDVTHSELVLMDVEANGTIASKRTAWSVDGCIDRLAWSRDGRRLLVTVEYRSDSAVMNLLTSRWPVHRVYVLDRDRADAMQLVELRPDPNCDAGGFVQTAQSDRAEWGPDDRRIALHWSLDDLWSTEFVGIADLDGTLHVVAQRHFEFGLDVNPMPIVLPLTDDRDAAAIRAKDFWLPSVEHKPDPAWARARAPNRDIVWFETTRSAGWLSALFPFSNLRTTIVIAEDRATGEIVEVSRGETRSRPW